MQADGARKCTFLSYFLLWSFWWGGEGEVQGWEMDSGNQGVGLGGAAPNWNYHTGEKFTLQLTGPIQLWVSTPWVFLPSRSPASCPQKKSTWFPPMEFNPILHSSTSLPWGDWESVRKLLLPQICKVKHFITSHHSVPGRQREPGCLLSASACRFGLHFANTIPVQAWGGQACASRLSAVLVLFCLETQAAGSCPLQRLNENVSLTGHY